MQESEKVLKNFVDKSLKKILVNILVTSVFFSPNYPLFQNPDRESEENVNESCPPVAKALFEDVRRQTRKEAPTCSKSTKNTLDALLFSAVLFIYPSISV